MAKVVTIQTDFTSGELSPRLLARVDLDMYKKGVKTLTNAYVLPHGGAKRAPGTIYVDELYDNTQRGELFRFVYSRTAAYLIVMNGGKIEFIKDRAFIETTPGTRYQIPCPYAEAELPYIKRTQVGTKMYFVHPDHPPKVLNRNSDTDWTLTDVNFKWKAVTERTYSNYWIKFKILRGTTDFVVGDSFTIDSSTKTVTPGSGNTGNGTIGKIEVESGAPSETWTITCDYKDDNKQEWTVVGSTSGELIADWYSGNYPAAVTVFQQRLYFGGTLKDPQKVWGSKISDYVDLTGGTNDDDGVQFTPDSGEFDQIVHLVSTRQLIPLTYSSEYSITGGSTKGITPTNFKISSQTHHGTSDVVPIRIGQEVLFVPRGENKLRAIGYSVQEDVNVAPDISALAEHLGQDGFKDMTFSQDPDYIAFIVSGNGDLLSLTHIKDFEITGWGKITTDGTFENVETIPNGTIDEPFVIVNRTINGTTKRYIEYIDYVDGAQTQSALFGTSGTPTKNWSGLDHLEGKTVDVKADGFVHPQVTVQGGAITLLNSATEIEVGLPYKTTIELLHPDVALPDGTSQGRTVSTHEVTVRLQDTTGLWINGVVVDQFRNFNDPLGIQVTPFTGDLKINTLGWDSPNNLLIEQQIPMPFTLLGVIQKITIND